MPSILLKAFIPPAIACLLWFVFLAVLRWDSNKGGVIIFWIVIGPPVSFFVFLPTMIAAFRRAPRYLGILVLNIVGPWFFGLGWFIALIWALVDSKPQPVEIRHVYTPAPAPPPLPPQT